jgi:hypothetical protein
MISGGLGIYAPHKAASLYANLANSQKMMLKFPTRKAAYS